MPTLRSCSPWLMEPIKHHYNRPEFILLIQNPYPLQLVPVTRNLFWRNGQGFLNSESINFGWDGGFDRNKVKWIQTLSRVFGNFPTSRLNPGHSMGVGLRQRQVRSEPDGSDRTCLRCQTRVSVTPKITRRIGLMKSGGNRTHTNQPAHSRLDANVRLGIGWTRDRVWTERCEGRDVLQLYPRRPCLLERLVIIWLPGLGHSWIFTIRRPLQLGLRYVATRRHAIWSIRTE